MFRRLTRWLLGDPIHVVSVSSVVNQDAPNKFFFIVKVSHDLTNLDDTFGLTFNLAAVTSLNGIELEDGRDDLTYMSLTNGREYIVHMEIGDMLEMLDIDDEDDDDDHDDDNDDPTPVTSDDFDRMMSAQ
tara:strand:- start:558 stop:947 length:390 start_codon:yes stop_codon:yes gene_type:complete